MGKAGVAAVSLRTTFKERLAVPSPRTVSPNRSAPEARPASGAHRKETPPAQVFSFAARPPTFWAMGLLLALAAALRFYALTFGMPQLVRPDELFIVSSQYLMLLDQPQHMQYWYPTLFHRMVFAVFGGGYFLGKLTGRYLNPVSYLHEGPFAEVDLYLLARFFSALLGTLTLLPIYCLGRRAGGPWTGVLAAGLLAVAYLPVRDGHFGVTDQLATFTCALAILAFVRYQESHTLRDGLLAGAALGVAISAKYTNVTLLPLLLLAHFWGCPPALRWGRTLWLALAAIPAASFLTAPEVYWNFGRVVFFMKWQSENNQYFAQDMPIGWVYFTTFTLRYGVGIPLMLAALAGAIWTVRTRNRPALFALLFFLVHFGFNGLFSGVFSRHLNPAIPPLCLLAALGIRWAFLGLRNRAGQAAAWAGGTALVLVGIVPNLTSVAAMSRLLTQVDTRVQAADWVYKNVPTDVPVAITEGVMFTLQDREPILMPSANKSFDPGQRKMPLELAEVRARGARYVITSEYVSGIRYDTRADIIRQLQADPRAVAVAVFSPFSPPDARPTPVLEPHDAWYLPFAKFEGVARPGPIMTIYRLDDAAPEG